MISRRGLGLTLASAATAPSADSSFSFVHFTDTHIQPELNAAAACGRCFDKINRSNADFVLAGGDLVFDAAAQPKDRAHALYDLYRDTVKRIEKPVHSAVGNHDVYGPDPRYAKKLYEERIGKRYYSFAHKSWHFIVLDSIDIHPTTNAFNGGVDAQQMDWLRNELSSIPFTTPLVVLTHVPLISAVLQIVPDEWAKAETYLVRNARQVVGLFKNHNLKAVLQGHTHIRETVLYNGIQFITSGAVCGNWWKGPRLGHPEGYAVLTVSGSNLSWRYETYGFRQASETGSAMLRL